MDASQAHEGALAERDIQLTECRTKIQEIQHSLEVSIILMWTVKYTRR